MGSRRRRFLTPTTLVVLTAVATVRCRLVSPALKATEAKPLPNPNQRVAVTTEMPMLGRHHASVAHNHTAAPG